VLHDRTIRANDERLSFRELHAKLACLDAVGCRDIALNISQQRERQAVIFRERFM